MKTQLTKPARDKARYTEEYKKEALELWRASGHSAAKVAAELGIRDDVKKNGRTSSRSAAVNSTHRRQKMRRHLPPNYKLRLIVS
jgi:transposase-like protein